MMHPTQKLIVKQARSAGIKLELLGYGHRIFLVGDRQTLHTEENR